MKYMIEFDLPDNDTVLREIKTANVAWGIWGYGGHTKAKPAQPGWIPWNNGELPEESGTYAVTVHDGATKRVTYAKYQKRLKRWELTGSRAYWKVLAWQPMPKPWEGR